MQKNDYIIKRIQKHLMKKDKKLSPEEALIKAEKIWGNYYKTNKDKIKRKAKKDKQSFEHSIDLEFQDLYMDFQMIIEYGLDEIIGDNDDADLWEKAIRDHWKGKDQQGKTYFLIINEIDDTIAPEKEIYYAKRKLEHVVKLLKENAGRSTRINKIISLFTDKENLYKSELIMISKELDKIRREISSNYSLIINYLKSLRKTLPAAYLHGTIFKKYEIVMEDEKYKCVEEPIDNEEEDLLMVTHRNRYIAFEKNTADKNSTFVFIGYFPAPGAGSEIAFQYKKADGIWNRVAEYVTCVS